MAEAGTGAASGGANKGVAPGAKIYGFGIGEGLTVLVERLKDESDAEVKGVIQVSLQKIEASLVWTDRLGALFARHEGRSDRTGPADCGSRLRGRRRSSGR